MTITLYTGFAKRVNSTKQPTSGTDVTVRLKDATSIEQPAFELSGGVSSYEGVTALKWGSRYYFVDDITSDLNGVTTIKATLDRGATYKTEIGATEAFIERCVDGNLTLRDEHIVTTDKTFCVSDISAAYDLTPSAYNKAIIAVSLANIEPVQATGGTSEIVYFDASGGTYSIRQLMAALYDGSVKTALEKLFVKPYEAILAVKYIPGFTCSDLYNTGHFSSDTSLFFGDHQFNGINTYKPTGAGPWVYTESWEFDLNYSAYYGSAVWRNLEPYSTWSVFLPFYGNIAIPAQEYINNHNYNVTKCTLLIKATIDLTTGELVYTRYRKFYYSGGTKVEYIAQEYRTNIGVEIPIQSANRDMLSFTSDLITGAGSVALMMASGGSTAGLVAMGASTVSKAVVDVANQHYQTAGSFNAHGTQICTAEPRGVTLIQTGYITQADPDDYKDVIGIPYMQSDTISNHSGFIKCANATVSMGGTQADKDAVNAMLNTGFFYE